MTLLEEAARWIERHGVDAEAFSLVERLRAAARPPEPKRDPFPRMRLVVDFSRSSVRAEPGDERTKVWLRSNRHAFAEELFNRVSLVPQGKVLTEETLLTVRDAYLAAVVAVAPPGSRPAVEIFRRG